jgi:dTDP-4-dehydrorhamnose 3,5-epimerase
VDILDTALPEVKIVVPRRIGDDRGLFSEVWNSRAFSSIGIDAIFVQDNHIHSQLRGTLRGLHYQIPPAAQGKLVRVTRGAIFDVAVDIRRGSPTFGCHANAVLSADNWRQLWVPPALLMDTAPSRTIPRCNTKSLIFTAHRTSAASPGTIRI